jgi:lipopolysaccharide/colanic/teichoic acid biosynthesis glycosyltransferase
MPDSFYIKYGKRIFDLVFALPALLILSPLFIVIAISIKMEDGGPVFFIQKRMGQNFTIMNFIKFRTMIEDAAKKGLQITSLKDPRITRVGKFLRKYKLDELPQFINVIRGEISIVGPRPEVEKYVMIFKKEYASILKIKPGITDFAALYYRDEEEVLNKHPDPHQAYIEKIMPEKISLYHKYMQEISFFTDVKIIAGTTWSMFR